MSQVSTLIIGSGVAAAAIAKRLLTIDPTLSILMLEAGQRVKMQDAAIWQEYVVSNKLPYTQYYDRIFPEKDRPGENVNAGKTNVNLDGARVFTYGGSTIHWGGWSFRMKPEDFKLKTLTGHALDWPFPYEKLEPYYGHAEHYLGVSGDSADSTVPRTTDFPFPAFPYTLEDVPVAKALSALGHHYAHLPIARRGLSEQASRHAPCQTTGTCKYCPFGARYSANNYLDDMVQWGSYASLKIQLGASAQRVLMSARGVACGVEYLDAADGALKQVFADTVVVAAGAIESSKLLKRSQSAFWPNGIGNDNDLLGRNIVTHPYFTFQALQQSPNVQRLQTEMNFPTLVSRHFDSPVEQAAGKFVLVNPPGSPKVEVAKLMKLGKSRAEIDAAVSAPAVVEIHGMVEVFSDPKNYIDNYPMPNFVGVPQTVVDFTEDAGFERRMESIQAEVERIFAVMDAKLLGKPNISWRADHAACTMRMSNDPTDGVTNADLQVHGVKNLYICSNGVFPNLGAVNPTLTLTALAIRLGDLLTGKKGAPV